MNEFLKQYYKYMKYSNIHQDNGNKYMSLVKCGNKLTIDNQLITKLK